MHKVYAVSECVKSEAKRIFSCPGSGSDMTLNYGWLESRKTQHSFLN